jgi:hypothetical protein
VAPMQSSSGGFRAIATAQEAQVPLTEAFTCLPEACVACEACAGPSSARRLLDARTGCAGHS